MDTESTRKLVLDYLKAQRDGDAAKITELLDEKVRWTPPASAGLGAPQGRDEVLQTMAEAGARLFDLATMKVDVKWMVAEGDKMVIRVKKLAGKELLRLCTESLASVMPCPFIWSHCMRV